MSCTRVYDFINGGTVALALPRGIADADRGVDGRHGLRPLLAPGGEALALLRDHATLLAERSIAR